MARQTTCDQYGLYAAIRFRVYSAFVLLSFVAIAALDAAAVETDPAPPTPPPRSVKLQRPAREAS